MGAACCWNFYPKKVLETERAVSVYHQMDGRAGRGGARFARRAAQGVAAAVLACSPPRSAGGRNEVRSSGRPAGRGRGRARGTVSSRAAFKAAGLRGRSGALTHAQRGGAGPTRARVRESRGRGGPKALRDNGLSRVVGAGSRQRLSSDEESGEGASPQGPEEMGIEEEWQEVAGQGSEDGEGVGEDRGGGPHDTGCG
ncbi:hypothetical protein NDU88_002651 [Pleurodeles waltl]|uniref:Uncharacterized protein n=1 Tax=Pleurodeles waltl TaxID=8319 RepID=A0AAV7M6L9_PLEWA|nr:hypothetical protein NDU88_002651 [Pleurodeles waltl]